MILDHPTTTLRVSRATEPQEIVVTLEFEHALDPNRVEFWTALLDRLGECVRFGGFRLPEGDGSTMSTIRPTQAAVSSLQLEFMVSRVDPGFWRVMLNVLTAAHVYNARLRVLDVRSLALSADMLHTAEAQGLAYPIRPTSIPFAFHYEEPLSTTSPRIVRVQFASPTSSVRRDFMQAVLAWDELANGGFPADGEHPFSNACDATAIEEEGDTVIHTIPNFLGAEDAFAVVVKLAMEAHQRGAIVEELAIEEG